MRDTDQPTGPAEFSRDSAYAIWREIWGEQADEDQSLPPSAGSTDALDNGFATDEAAG